MYGAGTHEPDALSTSRPPVGSWWRRVRMPESVCGVQQRAGSCVDVDGAASGLWGG